MTTFNSVWLNWSLLCQYQYDLWLSQFQACPPKFNPPKNPTPNFLAIKFPESIKWYNTKNRNISFEYPKKFLLKSSYPKSTCQNFTSQTNPKIENFKPKTVPSIIPVTWNLEERVPNEALWIVLLSTCKYCHKRNISCYFALVFSICFTVQVKSL